MKSKNDVWRIEYFESHPDEGHYHAGRDYFSVGAALVAFNKAPPLRINEQTGWIRLTCPDGSKKVRINPDFVPAVDVGDFDGDWHNEILSGVSCRTDWLGD